MSESENQNQNQGAAPAEQNQNQNDDSGKQQNSNSKQEQQNGNQNKRNGSQKQQQNGDEQGKEKSASPAKSQQPVQADVEELAKLTAHERVIQGYKLAKDRFRRTTHQSSVFCSHTVRDAYAIHTYTDRKTPQMQRKEAALGKKEEELKARLYKGKDEPKTLQTYMEDARNAVTKKGDQSAFKRTLSAWAKDTTPRGAYITMNWSSKSFPEAIPRKHVDPTPGPGAYTSPLHFVGL